MLWYKIRYKIETDTTRWFKQAVARKEIKRYIESQGIRKLQLGCGHSILSGWLNTDIGCTGTITYMDVRMPFPIENGTFDYVFTEHVIEHLTYAQGAQMLAECFRVLKPGGKLRVATPDMQFLIDLYHPDKTSLQQSYIKWCSDHFIPWAASAEDVYVINNFYTGFGHQFIYNEKVLADTLRAAGFSVIEKRGVGESDDAALRGLENVSRFPPGFLALESLVVEATKSE
jgi:predicted SAM-dependent methyltransferase